MNETERTTYTERMHPGQEPDGETPVPGSPAFVDAGVSVVTDLAAALGWRLGRSILTHSDIWGLVWRVDFQVKGQSQDSKLINRFICWGTADGKVLGTATTCSLNIAPL
jgi:hypothetical protein